MRAHDPRTHGARAHEAGPGCPEQYAAPDAGARGGARGLLGPVGGPETAQFPKRPVRLRKLSPRPEDKARLLEALVFVLSNTSSGIVVTSFKIRLVESYLTRDRT